MYWSRNKYIIAAFLIFSYLIIPYNAFAKVKTKDAVIDIATCADLQNINNQLTGEYVLTGDIDCTGFKFSPIGAPYGVFGGILDGAGHKIKNLTIYSTNDYVGLFREAKYASISRLTLENVNISGESSEGGSAVGGLIGDADHARVPLGQYPSHWMVYVNVENLDESLKKAEKLGAKVKMPATDVNDYGRFALIVDPTGAHIALWQCVKTCG